MDAQTANQVINLLALEIASLKAQLKAQKGPGTNDTLAEELATAREELETVKEELASVSKELRRKIKAVDKLEAKNAELSAKLERLDTDSNAEVIDAEMDVEPAAVESKALKHHLKAQTATKPKLDKKNILQIDLGDGLTKTIRVSLVSRHELAHIALPKGLPPVDLEPISHNMDLIDAQLAVISNVRSLCNLEDVVLNGNEQRVPRESIVRLGKFMADWCSERPQHGFFVRIQGKFKANSIGVLQRPLDSRVELFEKKHDGWFYVGTYLLIDLPPITPQEYALLSSPMQSFLVESGKSSTISAVTAHQQLKAGKITALCVGLRCIGFNHALYEALLDMVKHSQRKKRKLDDDSEVERHDSRKGASSTNDLQESSDMDSD